jgi:hypothetical protein
LTSHAYLHYFLAMAQHRLGHKAEAGKWLDKARAQTDREIAASAGNIDWERWNRQPTLRLLRAETEALLHRPSTRAEK